MAPKFYQNRKYVDRICSSITLHEPTTKQTGTSFDWGMLIKRYDIISTQITSCRFITYSIAVFSTISVSWKYRETSTSLLTFITDNNKAYMCLYNHLQLRVYITTHHCLEYIHQREDGLTAFGKSDSINCMRLIVLINLQRSRKLVKCFQSISLTLYKCQV